MKFILLLPIHIYWRLVAPAKRRNCLFVPTCSHFVYGETRNKGLLAGIVALLHRFRQCRQPVAARILSHGHYLILADGSSVHSHCLSESGLRCLRQLQAFSSQPSVRSLHPAFSTTTFDLFSERNPHS